MVTKISFNNPNFGNLKQHINYAKILGVPFVEKDRHQGAPGAVICSTGATICDPSVQEAVLSYVDRGYVPIFLKESLTYLKEKIGVTAKYAVSMDPGADRQIGRTPIVEGVTYCVATSCHPQFFDYLVEGGANVEIFNSACGVYDVKSIPGMCLDLNNHQQCVVQGEHQLKTNDGFEFTPIMYGRVDENSVYMELFGHCDVMEGGFTVSNRALALANYMGFKDIVMAGTDFGWRQNSTNENHYASFVDVVPEDDSNMSDKGLVDGQIWYTRPDQLASAIDLAWRVKRGEVVVLGDSLAAAIAKRDDDFVTNLISIDFKK